MKRLSVTSPPDGPVFTLPASPSLDYSDIFIPEGVTEFETNISGCGPRAGIEITLMEVIT